MRSDRRDPFDCGGGGAFLALRAAAAAARHTAWHITHNTRTTRRHFAGIRSTQVVGRSAGRCAPHFRSAPTAADDPTIDRRSIEPTTTSTKTTTAVFPHLLRVRAVGIVDWRCRRVTPPATPVFIFNFFLFSDAYTHIVPNRSCV